MVQPPIIVTRHIFEIHSEIRQMLPELHRTGRKVSINDIEVTCEYGGYLRVYVFV